MMVAGIVMISQLTLNLWVHLKLLSKGEKGISIRIVIPFQHWSSSAKHVVFRVVSL